MIFLAAARSGIEADVTKTLKTNPTKSTAQCRFLPCIFLLVSYFFIYQSWQSLLGKGLVIT